MKTPQLTIVALVLVCTSTAGGYWFAQHQQAVTMSQPPETPKKQSPKSEPKVLYWYDPMMPNQHFDKPGKSPFMDMQLVPKYAEESDLSNTLKIDSALTQNLGMRLVTVQKETFATTVDAVGTLVFNEREVAIVQARASGFVERVYAHAPGDIVSKGAPLADVLIPEWSGAQTEFLALVKSGDLSLIEAARNRLRLLGMPSDLIARVEKTQRPKPIITISAPLGGVIQSLDVRTGMTLMPGQTLAKINGISTIWLDTAVPEIQAGSVSIGHHAEIELSAFLGQTFNGKVMAILPEASAESRTLKVRVELPNRTGQLKPGMFARVRFNASAKEPQLVLPSEAIIRTGQRSLVIVAEDQGRYRPVEVEIGREVNGKTVILRGLDEGQKVVASGQFLIDSEASLKGLSIQKLDETGEHHD